MQINIFMKIMNMTKKCSVCVLALSLLGCNLSPGMHMKTSYSGSDNLSVYIESIDKEIKITEIGGKNVKLQNNDYKIGNGDQIAITVWGLPEIFPIANITPDQNLRRVDSNGEIYFPYVGTMQASGKTQNELREDLRIGLSSFFNDPQLDVSIARFNSQKIYLLGEITRPKKINITDIPLSLSDALGEANGLSTNSADGSKVFIIRQGANNENPSIYLADLSSPAGFIAAKDFVMEDNDIIYVNAKSTTRWNRVISQFFPFSSFLNSIDNLTQD